MSEKNHNCLNCKTPLQGKYCLNCGQKADTHRISIRHFISHDLLHGVFHIERGLFYTTFQSLKKRGRCALEYISGQRIKYYNVFYLSLILLGLNILAVYYKYKLHPDTVIERDGSVSNLYEVIVLNIKFIILTFIPLLALNSFILFRKKKHNYAEHLIAAGFCMVAILTLSLAANIYNIVANYNFDVLGYVSLAMGLIVFFWPLFFYYSYAQPEYKLSGYSWRIVVFYLLFIIELILLTMLLVIIVLGKTELEGKINFN